MTAPLKANDVRDACAEAFVQHLANDTGRTPDGALCLAGRKGFKAGWDAAIAKDPRVLALVRAGRELQHAINTLGEATEIINKRRALYHALKAFDGDAE